MIIRNHFFLTVLLIGIMTPAYSQILLDTLELEEVVVTATRTERRIEDIPGKVDMVNMKQLDHLPAQKVDDLLRFASGLNVNRPSGIFTMRPSVSLRGISGDEQGRTLVLMNGIPINTSDEGGVNWNRINPYNIQKVEIFKGPGSSLYGNNAMGGVINLITRKPVELLEGSVGMSYGTFNTLHPEMYLGGNLQNGLTWSLSGFYLSSEGYNRIPEALRTDPDYSVPRFLKEGSVSAQAGYEFRDMLNMEFQYDYYKDKRGEGEKIQAPDGEYRNFETHFSRMRFYGGGRKFNYDLNLFYQREHYFRIDERMRGDQYARFDVESFRDDLGALYNMNYQFTPTHTLTGGVEVRIGSVDGGDYYQTSEDKVENSGTLQSAALYLQDEIKFFRERLSVVGGLRLDRVSFLDGQFETTGSGVSFWDSYAEELEDNSWTAISPRLAMRYHFHDRISAYASYARGFRASILDDLSRSGFMWVGPKVANPALTPEYLDNFEMGLHLQPAEKLVLEPTVYYSVGKDFLYYVATGDSLFNRPVYRRENVTGVQIFGVEMDGRYELNRNLTFRANYTFNKSEISGFDERPGLVGKELKYTPRHSAFAGILWLNDILNTGLNILYKDRQFTDDENTQSIDAYWTMDLQLSHEFFNDRLMAALMVQDLFDNEFMETGEYISPGRLITVKLSYHF